MSGYLVTFVAGGACGAFVFYRIGGAVAKARRAWRDLVSTKDSIRFLWGRARDEIGRAIRYALVGAGIIAVAVAAAYGAVLR